MRLTSKTPVSRCFRKVDKTPKDYPKACISDHGLYHTPQCKAALLYMPRML